MITGKTISQLPSLTAVTSAVTIPVEVSSSTFNISVDSLAKSDSFTNNLSNFYSNPQIITKVINIPENTNAMMVGPTITLSGNGAYNIGLNSVLTIIS